MDIRNSLPQQDELSVREMIHKKRQTRYFREQIEKLIPKFLLILALISILTTVGIVVTLLSETIEFFKRVPFMDFFTGTVLKPLSQTPKFGILPLVMGTFTSSMIAMVVAAPIGLMSAIYLSQYASEKTRKVLKPLLELLAGIPTIVYGFFAFTFVTPTLRYLIPNLEATNILSPGIVMGVMIIPMIASLSEDAMSSVPNAIREGALGLGATRLEVTRTVIIPAALSGIVASFVLGFHEQSVKQ